jgi:hypothetical protein
MLYNCHTFDIQGKTTSRTFMLSSICEKGEEYTTERYFRFDMEAK